MPKTQTWKDSVLSVVADAPSGVVSLAAIKKSAGVTASTKRFFDSALAKLVEEGALMKHKASYKLAAKAKTKSAAKAGKKAAPKAAEPKPATT